MPAKGGGADRLAGSLRAKAARLLGCLLCSLCLTLGSAVLAEEGELRKIRITSGEWEPYLSNYSFEYGYANHVVSEAFKAAEIEVEWGFFPWKRAYELVRHGRGWHASSAWWETAEARRDFLLTEAVSTTSFVFFHRRDMDFDWKGFADLKGLEIGLTRGYQYGAAFDKARRELGLTTFLAASDEQLLKMLLRGRIDLFPNDPLVGRAQIKNALTPEEAARLTFHPHQFGETTLHLLISRQIAGGERLVFRFNEGMQRLRASGRLAELQRHFRAGLYDKGKQKYIRQDRIN